MIFSLSKKIGFLFLTMVFVMGIRNVAFAAFSYSQGPDISKVDQGGRTIHLVKLFIVSTEDQTNLAVTVTPATGPAQGQLVSFDANEPTTVLFRDLQPSTRYTVDVAKRVPGPNGTVDYLSMASLPAFVTLANTPSAPATPTLPVTQPTPSQPSVAQTQTPSNPVTSATSTQTAVPSLGAPSPNGLPSGQCTDGKDNQRGDGIIDADGTDNGDGKADTYGVDTNGDGAIDLEPDPSCFSPNSTVEAPDSVASTIIPCTDKCTFGDVFRLLNNIFVFFFKVLLIPIFMLSIMYAGVSYLRAQFNAGKKVDLKNMFVHLIGGVLLILSAWLIVRTILVVLGYQEGLVFFQN